MKTQGNTVLITGGATGVGLSLAEAFVKAGNQVVICGRRETKLREAKTKGGLSVRRSSPPSSRSLPGWRQMSSKPAFWSWISRRLWSRRLAPHPNHHFAAVAQISR